MQLGLSSDCDTALAVLCVSRPLPAEVLARKEVSELLLLAVTALPAADQELVFAFYFEERSRSAIANATGTTVKGIEARLYRVRNRLRDLLKDPERMDVR